MAQNTILDMAGNTLKPDFLASIMGKWPDMPMPALKAQAIGYMSHKAMGMSKGIKNDGLPPTYIGTPWQQSMPITRSSSSEHSCQSDSRDGCTCGGSCSGDVIESLNGPGPCFDFVWEPRVGGKAEGATEGSSGGFWQRVPVPCPGDWGIGGGGGSPVGFPPGPNSTDGTQIADPPRINSGPGQGGDPADRIKITCLDPYDQDNEKIEERIRKALSDDLQKIRDADKPGGVFDKLKGCSGANSLIRCLKSQMDNPQIKSIKCKDFDNPDVAMHTDNGNITVNPKKLGSLTPENLMHELMHICGASELDSYIMTSMFFPRKRSFTYENGIRKAIENEVKGSGSQSPYYLMDGFIRTPNTGAFAWNPETGEIRCYNSGSRGGLGKSLGTIPGH